jgi:hypothetical protein
MGEWKTVYEDEVEGRWVTLRTYESEDAEDEDDDPVVRVTVAPLEDGEQNEAGRRPLQGQMPMTTPSHSIPMQLTIGFSSEAAAWIVGKVPV